MSLLGRVIVEKRAALVPIALAIIGNLAAYGLVGYPLQARVASGEARVRHGEGAERAAERDLGGARATREGMQTAEVRLQDFYHRALPASLSAARKAAYVRLAQLAAESNLRYERQAVDQEREKNSHLAKLKLTIVLDGSYQDVRRFIHAIETAPEFLVIDNVTLMLREEATAPLVLTLAVSTYFWTEGNET